MATCSPMVSAMQRSFAHQRWAKYPSEEARRAQTAPARAGRDRRFYEQAHEMHPTATAAEIERCVASLKSAYYSELSMKRWANKKGGRAA